MDFLCFCEVDFSPIGHVHECKIQREPQVRRGTSCLAGVLSDIFIVDSASTVELVLACLGLFLSHIVKL